VNLNAAQGAGIQAGKRVAELGVKGLITGHVGPKAFSTLKAAGVRIYTGAFGTVADAIEQFKAGKLAALKTADVEAHRV
jgi:predicted Fe-Mo cluster-binding NifX family protein